jgi:predicted nuclease of restriction endonuclease-like (RecB) superfamily
MIQPNATEYEQLIAGIGQLLQEGRTRAYEAVNQSLVQTYWQIGRYIVEYEQQGNEKAEYGSYLLDRLSSDLTAAYGKGFSRSRLIYIRKFYLVYPIGASTTHQLSWTHLVELLKLNDPLERSFYEKQMAIERWSVDELKRQIKTALFQRLALSKDAEGVLRLAREGQLPEVPADVVRDPIVLDFLNIPEAHHVDEQNLEGLLITHLQQFLLELGKGFAFVGRQYRIPIAGKNFRVDLVFYHRILKCFVLLDLKVQEVEHTDIGQMNLYLNYFKKEENMPDDNEPIGIILAAQKEDIIVEYALGGVSNQIFVSKYQFYLPEKSLLEAKLKAIMEQHTGD